MFRRLAIQTFPAVVPARSSRAILAFHSAPLRLLSGFVTGHPLRHGTRGVLGHPGNVATD